jgi:hypothetical protein
MAKNQGFYISPFTAQRNFAGAARGFARTSSRPGRITSSEIAA